MKLRSVFIASIFTIGFLFVNASAQSGQTANTLKLDKDKTGAKAVLADVSWLAGTWIGTGLDGVSEEAWQKPLGGSMIGTYRLVKDGKPTFYEMMMLIETEGTLVLRLKHFNPDLVGWEEKDKTVDFEFVKADGKRIYFSGLTYEHSGKNDLTIYLALKEKDGTIHEEVFKMKRTRN